MSNQNQSAPRLNTEGLERIARVASYYGFIPAEQMISRGSRLEPVESILREALGGAAAAALSWHMGRAVREPTMFYHVSTHAGRGSRFGLEAVGIPKSIAEAFLIKAAMAIFDEVDCGDVRVYVNSVGDKDSVGRFTRELSIFFRKHIEDLPPRARELMKHDLLATYTFMCRRHRSLAERAPKPMEFLSEASRRHLREVLEYLETMDIPYQMDDGLIAGDGHYSQTVFEIRRTHTETDDVTEDGHEAPDEIMLARGGRYDELLKRAYRIPMSAARVVLSFEHRGTLPKEPKQAKPSKKPKVYFIQLGFDAKLRALMLIDALRKARVPLMQSLSADTLTSQLALAEKFHVPYAIIMGQKEVNENTVIIRNLETRAQETISVNLLSEYLRRVVH